MRIILGFFSPAHAGHGLPQPAPAPRPAPICRGFVGDLSGINRRNLHDYHHLWKAFAISYAISCF